MKVSSMIAPRAKRLEGKVALITGGASGIGESTARLFARHGAKVIIADVQDDLGHSLCKEKDLENAISYVHCDVTSDSDVQRAVNTAVSKHGKLDIMLNNAGITGITDPSLWDSDENFKKVIDVNLFGAFLGVTYASRVMIPKKKGVILFTSSIGAVSFGDVSNAYAASKHAVIGMTKNMCVQLGKHGIRVNCISPFGVATPMTMNAFMMTDLKKVEDLVYAASNLKEVVLKAEDIAEAALYLASDESKYVSGLNLIVDGGFSTTNTALGEAMKQLA